MKERGWCRRWTSLSSSESDDEADAEKCEAKRRNAAVDAGDVAVLEDVAGECLDATRRRRRRRDDEATPSEDGGRRS